MGGLCLGMSRREVLAKQDEVAAFSELGEFLERPFRTYSSGMQARLCFSTALACEPSILVVDEALSVGDVRFQRKCFAHFERLRARGTTILLVSHDMNAVAQICDRAVWLDTHVGRSASTSVHVHGARATALSESSLCRWFGATGSLVPIYIAGSTH